MEPRAGKSAGGHRNGDVAGPGLQVAKEPRHEAQAHRDAPTAPEPLPVNPSGSEAQGQAPSLVKDQGQEAQGEEQGQRGPVGRAADDLKGRR